MDPEGIRRLLQQFLDARDSGEEPALQDYLRGLQHPQEAHLFLRMLVEDEVLDRFVVEFERRRDAGENPDPEEYCRAFPGLSDRLRSILGPLPGFEAPGDGGAPPAGLGLGSVLGRFRLVRHLGRGAFGDVWEARQEPLERPVALKVLDSARFAAPVLARFQRECRILAGLDHPHIVPIHDAGQSGRFHYCAMKLLEGKTLAEIIERLKDVPPSEITESRFWSSISVDPAPERHGHPAIAASSTQLPPDIRPRRSYVRAAARILRDMAEALAVVHEKGVIHRDLKPQNIMVLRDGSPVVLDFGLAAREAPTTDSEPFAVIGTLPYMSPEQARGDRGDLTFRTDVFSFGSVAYEFLALQRPFAGSPAEIVHKIEKEDPPSIRKWNPRVPADLENILRRAMQKRPVDRYSSARELALDLTRFLNHEPVLASPPGPWKRAVQFALRRKALTTSIASSVAAVLVGLWFAGYLYLQRVVTPAAGRERLVATARELMGRKELQEAHSILLRVVQDVPDSDSAARAALVLSGLYFRAGYLAQAHGVIDRFPAIARVRPEPGDVPGAMAFGDFLDGGDAGKQGGRLLHDLCRNADPPGYETSRRLQERLGGPLVRRVPAGSGEVKLLRLGGGRRSLFYLEAKSKAESGLYQEAESGGVVLVDPRAGLARVLSGIDGRVRAAAAMELDEARDGEELALVWQGVEGGGPRLQAFAVDADPRSNRLHALGEPLVLLPGDATSPTRLVPLRLGRDRPCVAALSQRWAEVYRWDGERWSAPREGLLRPLWGSEISFLLGADVDGEEGEELVASVGEWSHYALVVMKPRPDASGIEWVRAQLVGVAKWGALCRERPGSPWDLVLGKSLDFTTYGENPQILGRFQPAGIPDAVRHLRFDPGIGEFRTVAERPLGMALDRYRRAGRLGAADLDGDGVAEIFWEGSSTREPGERDRRETIEIARRNGKRLETLLAAELPGGAASIQAFDLDGDGEEELILVRGEKPVDGEAPVWELRILGMERE